MNYPFLFKVGFNESILASSSRSRMTCFSFFLRVYRWLTASMWKAQTFPKMGQEMLMVCRAGDLVCEMLCSFQFIRIH